MYNLTSYTVAIMDTYVALVYTYHCFLLLLGLNHKVASFFETSRSTACI